MDEQNAYGNDFVTLIDDDGNEVEFEHIGTLEMAGETYMAFVEAEQSLTDRAELTILKTQMEDGEEILVSLSDEEELGRVYQEFLQQLEEEYDVEDARSLDGLN